MQGILDYYAHKHLERLGGSYSALLWKCYSTHWPLLCYGTGADVQILNALSD